MLRRFTALLLWRALALGSVGLGLFGVVVPVLPTVPFLLLGAWAAGKGWPRFEAWLLAHPRWGPTIVRWRDHGAVPRRAKWLATLTMLASAVLLSLSGVPSWLKVGVALLMAAVATWLWRRPET